MQLIVIIDLYVVIISINAYIQELEPKHRRTATMIYPASPLYSDIRFEMVMLCIMNKEPDSYLNLSLQVLEVNRHCLRNLFGIEYQYLFVIIQSTIKQHNNCNTLIIIIT